MDVDIEIHWTDDITWPQIFLAVVSLASLVLTVIYFT